MTDIDNQEIERLELESRGLHTCAMCNRPSAPRDRSCCESCMPRAVPEKWQQDAMTLANGILGRLDEWQAEAEQESQRSQDQCAGEAVMREYLAGYIGHVFKAKDTWKEMLLSVRREYGIVASLLGEASAYLAVVGTEDAVELDKRITDHMSNVNISDTCDSEERVVMNSMQSKAARRRWAAQWTENGLPRDTSAWTIQDWADLWHAMQRAAKLIAARHNSDRLKNAGLNGKENHQ